MIPLSHRLKRYLRCAASLALRRGLIAAALAIPLAARAQSPVLAPTLVSDQPVDVRAGRLDYDAERRLIIGREGVVAHHAGQLLRADYMEVNTETGDVLAQGNVFLARGDGSEWRGQRLIYNLRTRKGDFGEFEFRRAPYIVHARESEQVSPRLVRLRGVAVTTCDQPAPREYEIRAVEASIRDQRYIEARHAVVWLGGVPIFYLPHYSRDLQSEGRWDIEPGYTSRLGPLLMIAYNYPFNDTNTFRGATQLNLYANSGIGAEQRFGWNRPDNLWRGEARAFFIPDQRPFRNDAERAEREALLDSDNRYRLRLRHRQALSPADTVYGDFSFLSDPWVAKDFFRGEYREQPIPQNRIVFQHTAPEYTVSLLLEKRLNDFYEAVDRLPEVRLAVPPLALADTGLYYENRTAAARLERLFPKSSPRADYSALRLDTAHLVSYPGRYFGFLSLAPRAGWRGTYYSKTLAPPATTTNLVTRVGEDGVETTTTETVTTQDEEGAALRNIFEAGFDASFKAFRALDEGETAWGRGLRHVAEPYARHTWIPEPNRTPERLLQFDETDQLDEVHQVRLGLRNKLQTRRGGRDVHDLVDADVSTRYRIVRPEGENELGALDALIRLRPSPRFALDLDGSLDLYGEGIQTLNSRVVLLAEDRSKWNVEYRYRADDRNLLISDLTLWPRARWSFGLQHRYDLDESRLEEHGYWIQRRHACIAWSVGVSHEPAKKDGESDDFRAWLRLWLLAFPGSSLDLGG